MSACQPIPTKGSTTVCSIWDKGYRYGYQGSEKDIDINGGDYTTQYRQLDVRLGRWFSIDPELHPEQSPYCSMDNNPTYYNDIFGDDIVASRKERRQLRRRADWNNGPNSLKSLYGKGSGRTLYVKKTDDPLVTTTIYTAQPQGALKNGRDNNPNEFHLYYGVYEDKVFTYDNRTTGNHLYPTTTTFTKNYSTINVGNDFTRNGKTLNTFLRENSAVTPVPTIVLSYIHVKPDDTNGKNPAVYSFNLNGSSWGLGPGGSGGNSVTATFGNRFQPILAINLVTGDLISAQGIWTTNVKGRVDECNGFIMRISVSIRKKGKI